MKTKKQDLSEIYSRLETVMKKYTPPFTEEGPPMKLGGKNGLNLWTGKPVEIMGRKYPTLHFAGLIAQSNYVGFYYMPIYCSPVMKKKLKPELLKLLKGKTCFHVKALDAKLLAQIKEALDVGKDCYKKMKWL